MYTISDALATLGGIKATLGAIVGSIAAYTLIFYVVELARITKRKAAMELIKLQICTIVKKLPIFIKHIEHHQNSKDASHGN